MSSDDVFVASGGQDEILRFWDLNRTGHKLEPVSLPNLGIDGHGVWLIEVPTGSILVKLGAPSTIASLRISATGHWLIAAGDDGNLTCWSTGDLLLDKVRIEEGGVSVNERKMNTGRSGFMVSAVVSSGGVWSLGMSTYGTVSAFKGTSGVIPVGTVPEIDTFPHADLGPISDEGTGIIACCGKNENSLVICEGEES
ncbi:hypothetical protein FRB99_003300 [Tulasnella sp. 403]|nr:hypothetical protein FRB99_003300 [Tulasnella sp. 403]